MQGQARLVAKCQPKFCFFAIRSQRLISSAGNGRGAVSRAGHGPPGVPEPFDGGTLAADTASVCFRSGLCHAMPRAPGRAQAENSEQNRAASESRASDY